METATKWYVITGAPCSGKTSVLLELQRRGFSVVPETARAYIEDLFRQGVTMEAIRSDPEAFEQEILRRKRDREAKLPPDRTIFLDRGIPDSIAYFVAAGLDPETAIQESRKTRYRGVFFFEALETYHPDRERTESRAQVEKLQTLLLSCYRNLGYHLVHIPRDTVKRRADRILRHVGETDPLVKGEQFP